MAKIPTELFYTEEHEWARVENDVVTIGITDFAQNSLGDIVFVDLPEVGQKLAQNDPFGVVESIKSVSDLYSPVSGEVLEINSELSDSPEKCNEDPYSSWMVKLKLSNTAETESLLSPSDYEKVCE